MTDVFVHIWGAIVAAVDTVAVAVIATNITTPAVAVIAGVIAVVTTVVYRVCARLRRSGGAR